MRSESWRGGSCQKHTLAHWTGNSYLKPNSCSLAFWNKQQHALWGIWTDEGGDEGFGVRQTWIKVSVLPLINYRNLSEPQFFLFCKNGDNKQCCCEHKIDIAYASLCYGTQKVLNKVFFIAWKYARFFNWYFRVVKPLPYVQILPQTDVMTHPGEMDGAKWLWFLDSCPFTNYSQLLALRCVVNPISPSPAFLGLLKCRHVGSTLLQCHTE